MTRRAGEPEIDVELVRRLVAEQFPQWAHLPMRPVDVGGWDNRTFRLGDELAVRLPSAAPYAPQVDVEHRWLPVLAPQLPLPIPTPVARGVAAYPHPWSVRRWLPGEPASAARINDLTGLALALARFLAALARVDSTGGPEPGPRNFWRGGPLATYAQETWRPSTSSARGCPAPPRSRCGSRQWPRDGTVRPCGSTAMSPRATCSSATANSPR